MDFHRLSQTISGAPATKDSLHALIRSINAAIHAIGLVEEDVAVRDDYTRQLNLLKREISEALKKSPSSQDLREVDRTYTIQTDQIVDEYRSQSTDVKTFVRMFTEIWASELENGLPSSNVQRTLPAPINVAIRDLVVKGIYEVVQSPESVQETDESKIKRYLVKELPALNLDKPLPPLPQGPDSADNEGIGRHRILTPRSADWPTRISISSTIYEPDSAASPL